jgi:PAS domain S-box-containing protein
LWIGTAAGLNKLNLNTLLFDYYKSIPKDSTTLDNGYIWSIFEDRDGNIWIGNRYGLDKYNPGKNNFTRIKTNISSTTNEFPGFILTMYQDQKGTIWLGTFGHGLNKLIEEETIIRDDHSKEVDKNKTWKVVHHHVDFLSDNEVIYGILPDDNGNLWFSSNHGIWKFNPSTNQIKNYNLSDGLQSDEFNSGSFFKNAKGEMFFGGNNGFNEFHPKNIIDNEYIPSVVITDFKKFDHTVQFESEISEIKEIKLSYSENFFSFEFASLDHTNPQKNQFAYMLDGFDKDWIYCGTRNYASYTNLNGGEYIFKVRGSNNDGLWNMEGTSIRIIISPPFLETWWFRICLSIILIFLILIFMKYRIYRIQRRNKELEDLVSMRTGELKLKTEETTLQKTYFQQLFENTPLGIAMLDKTNKIVEVNKSFERIFGFNNIQIKGESIDKMLVPEFLRKKSDFVSIETAGDKIFEAEAPRKKSNGELIYAHIYGLPIRVNNQTVGIYAIYEDITEKRKIQEETQKRTEQIILHQSILLDLNKLDNSEFHEAINLFVEASSKTLRTERVSVWLYNEDMSKILCEDMYIQRKNLHEKGETLDSNMYPIYFKALEENSAIVADDVYTDPFTQEFIDDYLRQNKIVSMLDIPVRLKGHLMGVICFEHVGEKRRWTQEEQNFAISISELISLSLESNGRRRAEEELSSEKERLSVTLKSIGDGVITTDINGNVVLMNKVAEDLTGWLQEDAIGKDLMEVLKIINEKTGIPCNNPFDKILKSGMIMNLEDHTLLISKDGRERMISDSGAPIRDKESRIIGVVIVFRDITEKKKMEEEIIKNQKIESLGILAGGIAHDFNNFLTAILGNISLAKMFAKNDEKISKRLSESEKASLRARDLTQQLLTFSKGGSPIKKIIPIQNLIKDTVSFTLSGSKTLYEFDINENLWPVDCDEGQISQVISNIIINADQSMPTGGIVFVSAANIQISEENIHSVLKPGAYVKISLKDHGVGIPQEHLLKIFDPFYTTKQRGRGLGLATAFSILQKHDGYIDVESEIGSGSIFSLYLPAIITDEVKKSSDEDQIKSGSGKILLMDDDEMVRDFAKELISGLGYEVSLSKNGEEAIELFYNALQSNSPFDLVILDLTIPGGIGGIEVIKVLLEKQPEIKAIVSSGYSNDPVMSGYKQYGFKGVIPKPYKIEELSQVLYKTMNNK